LSVEKTDDVMEAVRGDEIFNKTVGGGLDGTMTTEDMISFTKDIINYNDAVLNYGD
jgi:hypothetical protein